MSKKIFGTSDGQFNIKDDSRRARRRDGERGAAMLIALMVLGLLTIFVAAALARVTTEALVMGNDADEQRTSYAAQASLETMTRNFNKIFDVRLTPTSTDLAHVQQTTPSGFSTFTFSQDSPLQTGTSQTVTIAGGTFQGLNAIRDPWKLTTTVTSQVGTQVQLTRTFYNNRIPVFQFGMFYNDDLEISPGAAFSFGGRVHTNGNLYVRGGGTLHFDSRVSSSGEIVVDVARNGWANNNTYPYAGFGDNIYIKDASGNYQRLTMGMGSVINGPDINSSDPNVPDGSLNSLWRSSYPDRREDCKLVTDIFGGNLVAKAKKLELPLKLGGADDNIELIKRGRITGDYESSVMSVPVDNQIIATSRYSNKPGIRISLADSQAELPGGTGGVRLDGKSDGTNAASDGDNSRGYKPEAMSDGYQASRLNGHRLYTGASYTDRSMPGSRQTWIKVEIVTTDATSLMPVTTDITKDFLSLGLTEKAPNLGTAFSLDTGTGKYDYDTTTGTDARAILKMQRWAIPGPAVKATATQVSGSDVFTYVGTTPGGYSVVAKVPTVGDDYMLATEDSKLSRPATVLTKTGSKVIPFPIELFDTREGLDNEFYGANSTYNNTGAVPYTGVMSLIDFDVTNFRRFVKGDFDNKFPHGLQSTDIPRDNGWLVYISDRRGDRNFDGAYTMEDFYGPNNGTLDPSEDVNGNGALDVDYDWEASAYREGSAAGGNAWTRTTDPTQILQPTTTTHFASANSDLAALFDHKYNRRAVRLVRGAQPPGDQNNGFTLATENGLYVLGNFNSTGVASHGTPTPPSDYQPAATQYSGSGVPVVNNTQVPSSLVADSVTILSNNWNDGQSFATPDASTTRVATETTVRAAVLTGDSVSSMYSATLNQGGFYSQNLNGSVNNFKRYLENWGGTVSFNYCGSLINLFASQNSTGVFKYGSGTVYNAPIRNWTFDDSFLDPTRLPPGTPFFQYVQITGFRRTNN